MSGDSSSQLDGRGAQGREWVAVTLAPQFRFAAQQHDDRTWIARVGGEIHVTTAPQLGEALNPIVERPGVLAVLDLADVDFIDSTGLSVLLSALRRVMHHGGALTLVCTNPTVLRLFEITHLDQTFAIHSSEAQALAALQEVAAGSTSGIP
jgi:anti-sigma B factor antagonist